MVLSALSSKINYQFDKDLDGSLMLTYKGRTRDYGGTDYSFKDQINDDYLLVDLKSSYKLFEGYNLDFSVKNLFDKHYENSLDYSGNPRTVNIGLKLVY